MGYGRLTRGGCAARLATAATFVLLAASMSEAQTATREEKEETKLEETRHSSCTDEDAFVKGRRVVRRKTQNNNNMMRVENRVTEWAEGPGVSAPVTGNFYKWDRDDKSEVRSSERTFFLLFDSRTRLFCQGNCVSAVGRGDDEIVTQRDCIDVQNGVARPCKTEPINTECK